MRVVPVVRVVALAILVLMFLTAGAPKLVGLPSPGSDPADFARWGCPSWARPAVGLLETAGALILLARRPRALGVEPRFLAALLLGADMMGAAFTLATHGEASQLALPLAMLALLALVATWSRPSARQPTPGAIAGAHP